MKFGDKKALAEFLAEYIPYLSEMEITSLIEIPPPEIDFTYAFPCFRLAKQEKKSPAQIAQNLTNRIVPPDFIELIEVQGPYINFRMNNKHLLNAIYQYKEDFGKIHAKSEEKKSFKPLNIVVEYPSPNTNKPLHLGHVRNMLIGNTISSLFQYAEHNVFQVNLNNDRGIHICKSMLAYRKTGNNAVPDKKPDHFVGDFYVKYQELKEEDEHIEEEALDMLRLWEEKDPEVRELWRKMNKWAVEGFHETYKKFNIEFDKEYFESQYYEKGKDKVLEGLNQGIFEQREDGAIVANLNERYNLPDKVLLRSDGTSIYITQDIYLAYLKKKDFNYDKSIYIVGNEQDLYFKQLFAVLEMIGFQEDKYHLSYGMISLPEGKMKSREGKVVDADDLVAEMKQLAYEEVEKRYSTLSEEEKMERAETIGMSALRFFILKFSPRSDFIFNPQESISFEGETGPYIQYCYARIQSIIDKSGKQIDPNIEFELLNDPKEIALLNQMHYFPEIVEDSLDKYDTHLIPQYLLALCQIFNSFYSSCPVISDNNDLEEARLFLIRCVQIIIRSGLNLLGIKVLKEM
ncbi:MAG: arginine--tRNA ligase [Promethearchaeota archaeon]|nr:MAG: arginine--tRNA ligase [Candidatus Lokiarchaeota archaeon]